MLRDTQGGKCRARREAPRDVVILGQENAANEGAHGGPVAQVLDPRDPPGGVGQVGVIWHGCHRGGDI